MQKYWIIFTCARIIQHFCVYNITIIETFLVINLVIFKRQSIDTDLLYQICMVLNVDLFSLFSEKLRQENNIIGACHSQKAESESSKRKIMLEVELDDEEYQKMIQKALNI